MQILLHPIPTKYLGRLNEPDKSRVKGAIVRIRALLLSGATFVVTAFTAPMVSLVALSMSGAVPPFLVAIYGPLTECLR